MTSDHDDAACEIFVPRYGGDWRDKWVARRPEVPWIAPFFVFLILMAVGGQFDQKYLPFFYALRCVGSVATAALFWRYYPPLGPMHLPLAVVVGLLTTVMWIGVHKGFASMSWYPPTQVIAKDPGPGEYFDPYARYGTGLTFALFLFIRIGGAAIAVPIVEELFWRGFVLRALVDWDRFESVPLGKFTWISFAVCSLASALEHPQWEVGILCWMAWNALFYYTKSLLCLMVTHGITNFALYTYVVVTKDWIFW